ncbi:DUF2510 domain-containing protein [Agromyces aureus]|uniref:DUF2510 domain-containing protein n=1 Tax=Agromyces aureus TaxID=453304 RepID=A0A191WI96_9MICO|nr:DUF2510 domain-containing protein [Agromyces aureus]ANJ28035.1 hypothetical protein ATC03_16265 [Agromyces aureus]
MPDSRRVAGWYVDETDAAALRYWDGASWTPHTVARAAAAGPSADASTLGVDADAADAATVSVGVTALRGTPVRRAGARGSTGVQGGGAHRSGASDRHGAARGASTTPAPVDTLADDFSISEMTSMRAGVTPSVTPIASGAAPIATAPPSFPAAPSLPAAPSFAAEPSFSAPLSFVRTPSAPSEHTTVPLPPTGFGTASARRASGDESANEPARRPTRRRIAWIVTGAVVLAGVFAALLANLVAVLGSR